MADIYLVISEFGEYLYKKYVAFATEEQATEYAMKEEAKQQSELKISAEQMYEMYDSLFTYEASHDEFETELEGLMTLFPEYTEEDFTLAINRYMKDELYSGTHIEKIPFIQ